MLNGYPLIDFDFLQVARRHRRSISPFFRRTAEQLFWKKGAEIHNNRSVRKQPIAIIENWKIGINRGGHNKIHIGCLLRVLVRPMPQTNSIAERNISKFANQTQHGLCING
jgi:hypothetical protein